jgi:uncharacterized protein
MALVTDTFANQNFLVPMFQIKLDGMAPDKAVLQDIQEVTFTDDMTAASFFEIVLNDWDPVKRSVKYSSPWTDTGASKQNENGSTIPVFEPGKKMTLAFGYSLTSGVDPVLEAEIVSVSASFPSSGTPMVRIRTIDAAYGALARTPVDGTFDGTLKAIALQLCKQASQFDVHWDAVEEGEERKKYAVESSLLDALANIAKEYKLNFSIPPKAKDASKRVLTFGKLATGQDAPVAEFAWGRTLQAFTPVLSAAAQVESVVVRGSDPAAKGDKQKIDVIKKWTDARLVSDAFGPGTDAMLKAASTGKREIIKPDKPITADKAGEEAVSRLRELAATMLTANGTSIGLPNLRAGANIKIVGVGKRYEGLYRLTQTTHAFGGAGYTTSFQARKEILAP